MKKNLLTLSVLAISLTSNAQEVLTHVDAGATFYVSPNTLVYNGGGLQTKDTGKIENHGNIMIDGTSTSVLRTLNASGTSTPTADRIVLKINDPANPITSGYGQLYIKGVPQSNITAIVDKEYAETEHGSYQQIGIPFYNKSFSELSTDLGAGFTQARWSGKEILRWSNSHMRMDGSIIPASQITNQNVNGITVLLNTSTTANDKAGYFSMGKGGGLNVAALHTVKGVPYDEVITKTLSPATITNYGSGGATLNIYRERYNTYLSDPFESANPWTGTYAKNIHQFSNPYLTNIDLSLIGVDEGAGQPAGFVSDGNHITNIQGIYVNPNNVKWNAGTTSSYDNAQMVTFTTGGVPNGPFEALVIKPFGTFKIKLRNNQAATLNFENLRRFSNTPRSATTSYSVTSRTNSTVKQLGIIALNVAGEKVGNTYYNVAANYVTGNASLSSNQSVQAFTDANYPVHTFEEDPTVGGIDQNYQSAYRLYINEANEVDFKGKKVALGLFDSNVKKIKFEIAEDAKYVSDGVHELSSGTGFYYTKGNSAAVQIKHGDIIDVSGNDYAVYYGAPTSSVLATTDVKTPNRTLVVYSPDVADYIVRFDPSWKTADINVYDMSGKLVHSVNKVKTSSDYVIKLNKEVKTGYVVKIDADNGQTVNTKILMK